MIITSKGVNVNIFFANTELSENEKFENLKALLEDVNEFIPRGEKNIKSITLQVNYQIISVSILKFLQELSRRILNLTVEIKLTLSPNLSSRSDI